MSWGEVVGDDAERAGGAWNGVTAAAGGGDYRQSNAMDMNSKFAVHHAVLPDPNPNAKILMVASIDEAHSQEEFRSSLGLSKVRQAQHKSYEEFDLPGVVGVVGDSRELVAAVGLDATKEIASHVVRDAHSAIRDEVRCLWSEMSKLRKTRVDKTKDKSERGTVEAFQSATPPPPGILKLSSQSPVDGQHSQDLLMGHTVRPLNGHTVKTSVMGHTVKDLFTMDSNIRSSSPQAAGTQFTRFTGTKVQILTRFSSRTRVDADARCGQQAPSVPLQGRWATQSDFLVKGRRCATQSEALVNGRWVVGGRDVRRESSGGFL